jgi:hypothetical protein
VERQPIEVAMCRWLWLVVPVAIIGFWQFSVYQTEKILAKNVFDLSYYFSQAYNLSELYYVLLLAVFVFFPFLFLAATSKRDPQIDKTLQASVEEMLAKGLLWSDIYASSDPVPGGELLGEIDLQTEPNASWRYGEKKLKGFRSCCVVNRLSILSDHISYWDAPNVFISETAEQILFWAGRTNEIKKSLFLTWRGIAGEPAVHEGLIEQTLFRKWRIRFFRTKNLTFSVLILLSFWLYSSIGYNLRDLLSPVWDWLTTTRTFTAFKVIPNELIRLNVIYMFGLAIHLLAVFLYSTNILDPSLRHLEFAVQRIFRSQLSVVDMQMSVQILYDMFILFLNLLFFILALIFPIIALSMAIYYQKYAIITSVFIFLAGSLGPGICFYLIILMLFKVSLFQFLIDIGMRHFFRKSI